MQHLQVQLEDLIAKEEHRPFLNPNYENEQSSILQANLSKKLISHLEAVGAKDKRKQEDASSDDKGQVLSSAPAQLVVLVHSVTLIRRTRARMRRSRTSSIIRRRLPKALRREASCLYCRRWIEGWRSWRSSWAPTPSWYVGQPLCVHTARRLRH